MLASIFPNILVPKDLKPFTSRAVDLHFARPSDVDHDRSVLSSIPYADVLSVSLLDKHVIGSHFHHNYIKKLWKSNLKNDSLTRLLDAQTQKHKLLLSHRMRESKLKDYKDNEKVRRSSSACDLKNIYILIFLFSSLSR